MRSQLTIPRIEALRFASGDEEIRETLYEEFGDALVEDFGSIKKQLTKRLAEWGSDDDDEDGGGGKSLPESKKKKLLKPETWQRDARLVELGTWLREHVGGDPFDDYNVFSEVATEKLAEHDKKPSAAELKLVLRGVSEVDEAAPPVIAKVSKPNKKGETKVDADPKHGRYRWGELPECLRPSSAREDAYPAESVVEFEPDADLRDSEQIPLLEPGGIEAFIEREVLPYTPDAWLQDKKGSVKIGYEISFTRHFYKPEPLRTLDEIRDDIIAVEKEAEGLLDDLLHGSVA
ncbi:type I restriction-modification system, M subunit [Rhodopirellula sallentina SM41]|uniref:Type I restriction-modification system, M subunit n=1 Tax=Rhodopirellula sallentina SM41 TaxID=1263870 RepID=M5UG09_9BACT|nr:type I restriction-modification system, M subunit [Rhodopirellula sallentina SM41]